MCRPHLTEEDPDYDNVATLETHEAAKLVQKLKQDFKGSGALWMPWRTEHIMTKAAQSKLAFELKLALDELAAEIDHINITKGGIIIYLKNQAKVIELAELGQIKVSGTGGGKPRPVWVFTKECLNDFTVLITDTIEQSEGKIIPVMCGRRRWSSGAP